jgi:hypothetical protein
MRFLVPERFKLEVHNWIGDRYVRGNRSKWFPFYKMPGTNEPAIMANIEPDDALAFALTFEHEKMDKE